MTKILIIDDDEQVRFTLSGILKGDGYTVIEAEDGVVGGKLFTSEQPDLVITDIFMPEREGLEVIKEAKRARPGCRIIAISGGSRAVNVDFLPMAKMLGADCVLDKPITREELLAAVHDTLALESPATGMDE